MTGGCADPHRVRRALRHGKNPAEQGELHLMVGLHTPERRADEGPADLYPLRRGMGFGNAGGTDEQRAACQAGVVHGKDPQPFVAPVDESDYLLVRGGAVVPVAETHGPDIVVGEDMRQRFDVGGTERCQNKAARSRAEGRKGAGEAERHGGPSVLGNPQIPGSQGVDRRCGPFRKASGTRVNAR